MSAQQQGGAHETQHSGGISYPVKEGALAGLGAYLAGYLVTFATIYIDLQGSSDALGELGLVDGSLNWVDAGMVFYNAQFVRLEIGESYTIDKLGGFGRVIDVQGLLGVKQPTVIDAGLLTFPVIAYTLVIASVVVAAGYLVANRAVPDQADVAEKMEAGMTVVVGYLPLAFIGSFLFEGDIPVNSSIMNTEMATANPDVFASVFIAGILFPLVFGAIGGYFAAR
jgi:hypothetical protein